uniref:GP41 n=1 Tax=Adoxophyes orana granulovirus TaxID=170617 RepID=A0A0A7UYT4_GVAO|nr:GP41 [Adoxophyes orana granulovirus]
MEKLSWNSLVNIINSYRINNTAKLKPEQILCLNTVRDLFLKADPLPVTATKRFENDKELLSYYGNLEKKYPPQNTESGTTGIFDKNFVHSKAFQSYADKFYNRRLNLAAAHLGDVLKYMIAYSITNNKPLPLLNLDSTTNEYLKLLYHKAQAIPDYKETHTNQMTICTGVFNKLIEDMLYGTHNNYYIEKCLSGDIKQRVLQFKSDINYLLTNEPSKIINDVYTPIREKAIHNSLITTTTTNQSVQQQQQHYSPIHQQLSELAFENETLRRNKIQELNVKYSDILNR